MSILFVCTTYYFIIFTLFTCITYCSTSRTPIWDEEQVSHEGAQTLNYDFNDEWVQLQEGGRPLHDKSTPSQVSIGASQLHGAPRASQPTQHSLGTPPLVAHP